MTLTKAPWDAWPRAGGRDGRRERVLAVLLVERSELVRELVTEDDLVLLEFPLSAGFTARVGFDGERLMPGIFAGVIAHSLQHARRAKSPLENVERSFRLAVDELEVHALLFGSPQVRRERLVP